MNFNTAGETYDAVVVTALAAQLAGSNQATTFAPYVNGVTFGGKTCTISCPAPRSSRRAGTPNTTARRPTRLHRRRGALAGQLRRRGVREDNTIDEEGIEYRLVGDADNATTDEGPEPAEPGATGDPW